MIRKELIVHNRKKRTAEGYMSVDIDVDK